MLKTRAKFSKPATPAKGHGGWRRPSALAGSVALFWIVCGGASAAEPVMANDGAGSVATVRDMGQEAQDMAHCLSGPNTLPSPPGAMTPQDCLDMFDYNDDFDVDLDDYRVYLYTLPFDAPPEVELGYAYGQPYETLNEGDTLPVHTTGQGFTHTFLYVRGFGFPPNCEVNIARSGIIASTGEPVGADVVIWSIFPEHGVGVNQLMNLFFLDAFPVGQAEGEELILTYTVEMVQVPFLTANITRRVLLHEIGG